MKRFPIFATCVSAVALLAVIAISQEAPPTTGRGGGNRAASTRQFLGLGPEPDKAAADRGAPLFQQNCSFCHGAQARGAEGPSLITSAAVLDDNHGEKLVPFLKVGRPEKGMPAFPQVSDDQLKDIVEFVHLQVEIVANRGTYQVPNILVGDAAKGKAYVTANCMSCHKDADFDHIAGKFRSADQLQHGWVWPQSPTNPATVTTATIKMADGSTVNGRLTQISDFRVTVVDSDGQTHAVDRQPGVDVQIHDPLVAHEELIPKLKNDDLHNVTAYLETLK